MATGCVVGPTSMKLLLTGFMIALGLQASSADEEAISRHARLASEARQRGDFNAAASEWEAIIALAPRLPEARSNLGMMWHFAEQYPKAISAFQQALQLNPKLVSAHLFLGIDYYLISRPRQAIPELLRALALEPANPLAGKWLGMSYFQAGAFEESAVALGEASRADSSDLDLLFFTSRVYSKLLFHSFEVIRSLAPRSQYLDSLRAGTDLTPGDDPEISRLASLVARGGAEAAFPGLLALTRSQPDSPEVWYWLAKAAEALALQTLDAFLTRSPASYRTHQLKAEHYRAMHDDAKAEEEYREVLKCKPEATQIHLELGNIFMASHDREHAIPEYEAELHIDPYSLVALNRIGQAYADMHEPARAQEYLARALEIDPDDYEASLALGKVKYELGDYADALRHYMAALHSRPTPDSALLFQISRTYRSLGDGPAANTWLARFRRQLSLEHQKAQDDLTPQQAGQPANEPQR